MSRDITFLFQDALKAGVTFQDVAPTEGIDDRTGEWAFIPGHTTCNIAGYQGLLCPSGNVIVSDKPETRAALSGLNVPFEA